MKNTIQNGILEVSILDKGVEICSIKSIASEKEYLWQANPEYWASHAPVLFPAIGALKNGKSSFDEVNYEVPRHGFIRHNEDLQLISKSSTHLTYELLSNESTRSVYPFEFNFQITYQLKDNCLLVKHRIHNLDDKPMPFCLGGHPAFNCPIMEGESYEDYYLEFETEETVETTLLSDKGLLTNKKRKVLENTKRLPLHSRLFDNDALIFRDLKSSSVSLKSNKTNFCIKVAFSDFPFLGVWAKPGAPFVCIEPWIGVADHENTNGAFNTKDGVKIIDPKEVFQAKYSIEI